MAEIARKECREAIRTASEEPEYFDPATAAVVGETWWPGDPIPE